MGVPKGPPEGPAKGIPFRTWLMHRGHLLRLLGTVHHFLSVLSLALWQRLMYLSQCAPQACMMLAGSILTCRSTLKRSH